ncbi:MAG TPA: zinc ribbon domain-containing protein [Candidatus Koribacter sp.]|jgi:putative FmdB family regulatory protein
MPIFEYVCAGCGHKFETIVMGSAEPECPKCHAHELEQQLSKFSAHSKSTAAPSTPCGASSCCMGSGGCDLN